MKRRVLAFLMAIMFSITSATDVLGTSVVFASEISEEVAEEELVSVEEPATVEESEIITEEEYFQSMVPDLKEFEPVQLNSDDLIKAVYGDDGDMEINGAADSIEGLEKYDPREEAPDLVTKTKNQNPYGTCWAFGAIGMIETNLLKRGYESNTTLDLSEYHLAYFAYNTGIDKLGNSEGDEQSGNHYLDYGGTVGLSATTFINWHGVASEADYPYKDSTGNSIGVADGQNNAYLVSDVYFLPTNKADKEDKKKVFKKMINEYGAVTVSYFHNSNNKFIRYNKDSVAYNTGDNYPGINNHEVTLVGWDDNYSKDNFALKPENDGAWLLKNSWGSDWGNDGGYFYCSYEDESLGAESAVFIANDKKSYDNNYFHNNLSSAWSSTFGGAVLAEVFEIKTGKESIEGVTFGTDTDNVEYKIDIYKLDETKQELVNDPTAGTLLATEMGKIKTPGFHTVNFSDDIKVNKGDLISIVISPIGDSSRLELYSCNGYGSVTKPGESFSNIGSSWADLNTSESGLRINLLTNTVTESGENPEDKLFTVTIQDSDGQVLKTRQVKTGYHVLPLANPKGYKYEYDYDFSKPITADTVIVASLVPLTYEIKYVLNGGTNSELNPVSYKYTDGTIKLQPAEKEGYEFDGWCTDDSYDQEIDEIRGEDARDYTLYALFTGENGMYSLPMGDTVNEDEKIGLSSRCDKIYYTIDGSTPTVNSPVYTGPFTISQDTVVKMMTVENGKSSKVFEHSYKYNRISAELSTDKVELKIGESVKVDIVQESEDCISASWQSEDDTIAEVRDGVITGHAEGRTTVSYVVIDKNYKEYSSDVEVIVTKNNEFAIWPKSEYAAKYYEGDYVYITGPDGAEIYYTLDGSTPTKASTKYTGRFQIDKDIEIKAVYVLNGKASDVISQRLTFVRMKPLLDKTSLELYVGETGTITVLEQSEEFDFLGVSYFEPVEIEWDKDYEDRTLIKVRANSPCSGNIKVCSVDDINFYYNYAIDVDIVVKERSDFILYSETDISQEYEQDTLLMLSNPLREEGGVVRYTTDGTKPTTSSTLYTAPFTVDKSCTVKAAIFVNNEKMMSLSQDINFVRMAPLLSESEINLCPGEKKTIEVLEHGVGANPTIWWYSVDSTIAEVSSDGEIRGLSCGTTTVKCFQPDRNDNVRCTCVEVNVTAKEDTLFIYPNSNEGTVCDYDEGSKIIINASEKAKVYYTLDGTEPTISSTLYTKPFLIDKDIKIRAISVIDNQIVARASQDYKYHRMYVVVKDTDVTLKFGESKKIEILEYPDGADENTIKNYYTSDKAVAEVINGEIISNGIGTAVIRLAYKAYNDTYHYSDINVTVEPLGDNDFCIAPYSANGAECIYYENQLIKFAIPKNARVFYTLDGKAPTSQSTEYSKPFTIDKSLKLRAIAVKNGKTIGTLSQSYKFFRLNPLLSTNEITVRVGETKRVTVLEMPTDSPDSRPMWGHPQCDAFSISDGYIRGLKPGSGVVFCIANNAIGETGSTRLKVNVIEDDGTAQNYLSILPKTEGGYHFNDQIKVSIEASEGMDVYYTLDGTEPTKNSNKYTGPFDLDYSCHMRAVAYRKNEKVAIDEQVYYCHYTRLRIAGPSNIYIGHDSYYCWNSLPDGLDSETMTMTWRSSDESVAVVDDGVVTGISKGRVTISATCKDAAGNEYTDSIDAEVSRGAILISCIDSAAYTGSKITLPSMEVYDGQTKLTYGTDYTVSYKNNIRPGTATATVILKGKYSGKRDYNFTIYPAYIGNATVSNTTFSYTNRKKTNKFVVNVDGRDLVLNRDYEITSGKAGDTHFEITGKGNYSGSKSIDVKVLEKGEKLTSIANAKVKLSATSFDYDGYYKEPTISSITIGKTELTSDDYEIGYYKNNYKAGTASVVICGRGKYYGRKSVSFKIARKEITDGDFSIPESVEYVKGGVKPEVKSSLLPGRDFKLYYSKNTKVGTATVKIVGIGSYKGTVVKTFSVTPRDIRACTVVQVGKNKVVIFDTNGKQLSSADFKYVYNKTDFTYEITAKGNYTGTILGTHREIAKTMKSITGAKVEVPKAISYTGETLTAEDIQSQIKVTYKKVELVEGTDYYIETLTKSPATGNIYFYIVGKGQYYDAKKVKLVVKQM